MPFDRSAITVPKLRKYGLFALGGVLALAILIAAALTARLAVGPVSVAFLSPGLRESLSEKLYYAYKSNSTVSSSVGATATAIPDWRWSA